MPPKKRGGQDTTTPDTSTTQSSAPSKRQRVSLACDACRIARERCDGGRPTCATCLAQKRNCSYTPASKKRGVQTGYLRTVELSLAWMCDNFPEAEDALHQLLRGDDTARLLGKDRSGNQLHKKWTKSKIHKEIGRFLSDGGGVPADNPSPGDSESESDPLGGDTRPRRQPESRSANACLPGNWRRLVDIYFSYTHCWFPIVNKESIINTAQAFPAGGIPLQSMVDFPSAYAELWAVLALASFQDAASLSPAVEPRMSPQRIYFIARNMMPSEERRFELPHLRALLLHSIVLIGQGAGLAAWMLVGTAVRLALHLRETGELYATDGNADELVSPGALAFTACLVLNTFTSACLGQPTFLKVDISDIQAFVDTMRTVPGDEQWHTVPGIGPSGEDAASSTLHPLRTFHQLYRFTQILSISLDAEARREKDVVEDVTTEDLVKCLEPQFAFCSSVLYGGSTPLVPSAFILQTAFLAITIHLVTGYRASLLSSLVEVIESCVSQFGTCGTPPIVVGMLGMVHRCGHIEKMHDGERQRWTATIESLRSVWRRPAMGVSPAASTMDSFASMPQGHHHASSSVGVTSPDFMGMGFDGPHAFMAVPTPGSGYMLPGNDGMGMPQRASEPFQAFPTNLPTRNLPTNSPSVRNPSSGASRVPWASSSALMAGPTSSSASQGHGVATPLPVDYDAILEELGSIDCTDGLDMDPQFMTNLGFAPGADLGEMFQADFGA